MTTLTARHRILMFTLLALVVSLGVAGWAIAGEADGERVHKIRIDRRAHCEGEDCEEGDRHVIFIDEDGETQVLGGGDFKWIDDDGEGLRIDLGRLGGGHFMKIMHGAHKGGFLGVRLTDLTPELRAHFGVPEGVGVMVSSIVDDTPAQRAGLQVGDIITLVDGDEIASGTALAHAIGGRADGESVTLEVWRDGKVQQITAAIEERERSRMAFMPRIHLRHGVDGEHAIRRRIEIRCDDDTDDCAAKIGHLGFDFDFDFDFDCESDECEVRVLCEDDGCTC
ncbi:MAG: PDZ domain-containing protein, partial [Acidobacteria bacterium]|nr:PDZ domain-containing protein [Acidobacteriota bacterium]